MKRRLMIARALIHEPQLLILDEPTAGVDIEVRRSMWEFLRRINEQGTTIILTTHYLEEAENLCRHIAIIDEGRIIENDRMSTVLRKLHTETFVLNLRGAAARPAVAARLSRRAAPDETTLEVEVNKDQNLNDIFARAVRGRRRSASACATRPTASRNCSCASSRAATSAAARPRGHRRSARMSGAPEPTPGATPAVTPT